MKSPNEIISKTQQNTEGIYLKCRNCGHEWHYGGKNPYYATCPFCLRKVKVEEYKGDSNE